MTPAPHRRTRAAGAAACLPLLAGCGPGPATPEPGPPVLTPMTLTATPGAGQPRLLAADGRVLASWQAPDGDATVLRLAELEGRGWGTPKIVARGEDLFVNWADFPSVVPLGDDRMIAHWLVSPSGGFGHYDIYTATSADGGDTWSAPELLNADGTETEHGFVELFPWDGGVAAIWLDGRRLADWTFEKELAAEVPLGVSLRYARMAADGTVLERAEVDELVCDCCQPDVAVAATGPVLTYRDRTDEEIRDIVVRRFDGERFGDEQVLGPDRWEIDGCPVNGPAVAAHGRDVVVAWFTAAAVEGTPRPRVRLARSRDGGTTFGAPVDVDGAGAFGQVDVVLLDDATAVVSWWRDAVAGGIELVARRVASDGALGPVGIVARSDVAQPIDVPQMVRAGDALVFAWTRYGRETEIETVFAEHFPPLAAGAD